MVIELQGEFMDFFSKDWQMDQKSGVTYKIAVLNDKFFSDKDRILNLSITEELFNKLGLSDRSVVRQFTGKMFKYVCDATPTEKSMVRLKCTALEPLKKVLEKEPAKV
jgi:hypothetical protein